MSITGVPVIDIHSVFVAAGFDKSITCDGCHPVDGAFMHLIEPTVGAWD